MEGGGYRRRFLDDVVEELLAELPALLITGPRGCGKTTTAQRYAKTRLSLDVPATAAAVRADPDAFLARSTQPILIDDWQEVPEVLGAVKRRIDQDSRPGQFILTGSVRNQNDARLWPGTGRLVRVAMAPMAQREIDSFIGSVSELFLNETFRNGDPSLTDASEQLPDYLEVALRGGFPQAITMESRRARRVWLDSYVEQLLVRDLADVGGGVDEQRLKQYVQVLALNTAGIIAQSSLASMSGITVKTSDRYDTLLSEVGIIDNPTAWVTNRLSRIEKRPKRFLVDMGLAASLARLDVDTILHDGNLIGRWLEGLVMSQLRAETLIPDSRMSLHHLRTANGRQEIDFIIEGPGGRVIALEVKAGANVTERDARHLGWLRDSLGEAMIAGVVLHTGPYAYALGERLWALPIATLWR